MIKLIKESEKLPVDLSDLKNHLRQIEGDFEPLLSILLKAAILHAENFTGQQFISRTYSFTGTFSNRIKTDIMPISVVTTEVDGESFSGSVQADGSSIIFPADTMGKECRVTFTSGYTEIPADVKAAILLIAAKLFTNPADSVESLPKASTNLLRPYKRWAR